MRTPGSPGWTRSAWITRWSRSRSAWADDPRRGAALQLPQRDHPRAGHPAHRRAGYLRVEAEPGDIFLLCSDGLTGEISDQQIEAMLCADLPLDELCVRLIDAANRRRPRQHHLPAGPRRRVEYFWSPTGVSRSSGRSCSVDLLVHACFLSDQFINASAEIVLRRCQACPGCRRSGKICNRGGVFASRLLNATRVTGPVHRRGVAGDQHLLHSGSSRGAARGTRTMRVGAPNT